MWCRRHALLACFTAQIAEEGAVTTASFAERVLPKVTLSYEMEPGSGAIVQKGVHKVGRVCAAAGRMQGGSAWRAGQGGELHQVKRVDTYLKSLNSFFKSLKI
jgi:hypothetical protein